MKPKHLAVKILLFAFTLATTGCQVPEVDCQSPYDCYEKGVAMLKQGRKTNNKALIKFSILALNRAVEEYEDDDKRAGALKSRADAYGLVNRPIQAIADYTESIRLSDNPHAKQSRGCMYNSIKKHKLALEDLQAVCDGHPDSPSCKWASLLEKGKTQGVCGIF
jgi:tetratricopeptide (TPR) repeat protein